jgi:hypothetical protein
LRQIKSELISEFKTDPSLARDLLLQRRPNFLNGDGGSWKIRRIMIV